MKNLFKKTLVFVLSAAMALSFSMPAKTKADTYTKTFEVTTRQELTAAQTEINADTSGTGNYLIVVKNDILADSAQGAYFELLKNKARITSDTGHTYTLKSGNTGQVIYCSGSGAELTLDNITLEGDTTSMTDNAGVIYVLDSGKVVMNSGTTIQNNKRNNYLGGGVTVQDAIFEMNGGTIYNCGIYNGSVCFGGGVAVFCGGLFTMKGGSIDHCYATTSYVPSRGNETSGTGGGVYVAGGSTFIMDGGTISNNSATDMGGGVACNMVRNELSQVSWANTKSRVEINGGTISGNTAAYGGGIVYTGYKYSNTVAIGYDPAGIGTPTNPGLFVNGGNITGNTASEEGGGIYTMYLNRPINVKNATISNNEASEGGGIDFTYNNNGAQIENCTISGNSAQSSGGGIMLYAGADTHLKDSTVTSNTSGELGAGVAYDEDSLLYISGVNTIQDNTYDGKKNNLNILDTTHLVYVEGDLTGSEIGISDPVLWGDGISDEEATVAADKLTSGYKTNNPSLVPKDAFTSDHATWYPDYSEDGNEVRLVKKTNNSKIKGGNILVDGLIGVTLWVDLDASTEAEREAYSMQFTLDDHTGAGEVQTATYDKDKTVENPSTGDTYYGFTFEDVKAPQMADEITAELLQDGDKVGVEKVYSVEQYAENMINKDSTKQDYKDFLRPMLNYGAFAQKYFNYNKSDLANKNNDMSDTVYEQTVDSKYELSTEGGLDGIAVKHFGMALNDGVDLHFEFTADSNVNMDEYTAVLNDDPDKAPMFYDDNDQPTHQLVMPFTELETQGVKTYYVNVYNIPAHRYDDTMTVTLYKKSDPATTFKIHFSVLSYAYEIIEKNADVPEGVNVEDLKNLLKSMVLYNVWAEKYFNKYPGEYIRTKRVITEKA